MNGLRTLIVLAVAAPAWAQPAPTSAPRAGVSTDATAPVVLPPVSPVRAAGPGSSLAVVIEQVLDSKIDFEARDQNIVTVLADLTRQTGVRLVVEQDTLDRLPYGEQTKLNAKVRDASLRDTLKALLTPIGLTFEVRSNEVGVVASSALRRLVRRATWEDLDTLRKLNEQPWSETLWQSLNVQFQDGGTDEKMDRATLGATAARVGAGPAADVLTIACNQLGLTWFPSGDRVVVLSKRRQLERQLSKRISAKFFRVPISDVLLDLGREGGVLVKLEPGALASLPPHIAQTFTLAVENTSLRQALEVISGTTGLGFVIEQDGVRFTASQLQPDALASNAEGGSAAALQAARASAVVGMVTVRGENGKPDVAFLIRESDLPPDLRELHRKKIDEAVRAMRDALGGLRDHGVE